MPCLSPAAIEGGTVGGGARLVGQLLRVVRQRVVARVHEAAQQEVQQVVRPAKVSNNMW